MEYVDLVVAWVSANWLKTVGVLYILDKIAKVTPWPVDDFVVDTIREALKVMTGRKQEE